MSSNLTLTTRQRRLLAAIKEEWHGFKGSPNHPTLKQLEKRGLIEMRIAPGITPKDAMLNTLMGNHEQWQIRRK